MNLKKTNFLTAEEEVKMETTIEYLSLEIFSNFFNDYQKLKGKIFIKMKKQTFFS